MAEKRFRLTRTREIEGFQHAQDDYWMQPLVFGSTSSPTRRRFRLAVSCLPTMTAATRTRGRSTCSKASWR